MTQFAFLHKQNQETIIGSDQYLPLDGRLNIFNAIEQAKRHALRLSKVRSDIYSVRIYKGSIRSHRAISGYHVV